MYLGVPSPSVSYVDNTLNSLATMAFMDIAKGVQYVNATPLTISPPADLCQCPQPSPRGGVPRPPPHPPLQPENAADHPGSSGHVLSAAAPSAAAAPLAG